MNYILVSTWKSVCSGCAEGVRSPQRAVSCPHCNTDFDGVIMLVATDDPFHATLPHVAPIDAPNVDTLCLTWCRPFNARLPYEVVPV